MYTTNKINETYCEMTFAEFWVVAIVGKYGSMNMDTMLPRYAQAQRDHKRYPTKELLPDVLAALLEKEVLAVSGDSVEDSTVFALTELGEGIYKKLYHKEPVLRSKVYRNAHKAADTVNGK